MDKEDSVNFGSQLSRSGACFWDEKDEIAFLNMLRAKRKFQAIKNCLRTYQFRRWDKEDFDLEWVATHGIRILEEEGQNG